ncbi:hypothetical protein, partial [Campylobacter fetus]|uniref:putative barnase/colicin E5 family endoribonuclease n=1 Tax=Campylobacter fetus TaxID=196 RepID=UPI000B1A7663
YKIGLNKILSKHLDDFSEFEGVSKYDKLNNALNEIISAGKLVDKNGVKTIFYHKGDKEFKVGLSKGFNGVGDNSWVITACDNTDRLTRASGKTYGDTTFTAKRPLANPNIDIIPQNTKEVNPTSNKILTNEHIGGGLAGGAINGVETDENGNISFDPAKFVAGFLAGAGGVAGIKRANKFLKDNPQFKETFKNELSKTLSSGWENAKAKNPLLKTLETNKYIVQNKKGASANDVINAAQKMAGEDYHGIDLKGQKTLNSIKTANETATDIGVKINEFSKAPSEFDKKVMAYEYGVDKFVDNIAELAKKGLSKVANIPGGDVLNSLLDFQTSGKAVGEVFQSYREAATKNTNLSSKVYKGLSSLKNDDRKALFHAAIFG